MHNKASDSQISFVFDPDRGELSSHFSVGKGNHPFPSRTDGIAYGVGLFLVGWLVGWGREREVVLFWLCGCGWDNWIGLEVKFWGKRCG